MHSQFDAAIVGGGFAGTTLAAELASTTPADFRLLIASSEAPGPGAAYAPGSTRLLMNGTSGMMSAVSDDKQDLLRWLRTTDERALISRRQFGRYLSERFAGVLAGRPGFEAIRAEIVDLVPADGGYVLEDGAGVRRFARDVILALGNFPPDDSFLPDALRAHPGYVADPWRYDPCAEAAAAASGDVLVIGSGLTAVDAIALLDECGFRGNAHIVSRHGLLPATENPLARALDPQTLNLSTKTPYALLRSLRAAATRHIVAGGDWRDVVESIRRLSPAIWAGWNMRERRRFLRHLQRFWAVHRYRVPPDTAATFDRLERQGRIRRHRGSIAGACLVSGGAVRVTIAGPDGDTSVDATSALNCTGPDGDYERIVHPLVRNLRRRGMLRADPLRLGLEATPDFRVIDRTGEPQPHLFAFGPPLRGMWYETTAVPETREQAACIARMLERESAGERLEVAS